MDQPSAVGGRLSAVSMRVRDVDPGDVVIAPPSTEVKVRWRPLIKDIAQIFGSVALGIAAVFSIAK